MSSTPLALMLVSSHVSLLGHTRLDSSRLTQRNCPTLSSRISQQTSNSNQEFGPDGAGTESWD